MAYKGNQHRTPTKKMNFICRVPVKDLNRFDKLCMEHGISRSRMVVYLIGRFLTYTDERQAKLFEYAKAPKEVSYYGQFNKIQLRKDANMTRWDRYDFSRLEESDEE